MKLFDIGYSKDINAIYEISTFNRNTNSCDLCIFFKYCEYTLSLHCRDLNPEDYKDLIFKDITDKL